MKHEKIIAVDVGNTTIIFAWMCRSKVTKLKKIPTAKANRDFIEKILGKEKNVPLIICSVVPKINRLFKKRGRRISIIGPDITVPIHSHYNKKNIGMDRLLGAWTAVYLFPKTRLVIDFGTAITLDFISSAKEYQGGIILPGIGSTQRVLSNCSLLPKKISYIPTKKLIPTNTIESISKGIDTGFACMINALIEKYIVDLNLEKNTEVVITGGDAQNLLRNLRFAYRHEPHLIFKGIYALHELSGQKTFSPSKK